MAQDKAVATEVKEARKRENRRPFGVPVSRLGVNEAYLDEAYRYRWVNDEPGRLHLAQESGYSFVEPSEIGRGDAEGETRVKELVGVQRNDKDPLFAYLMKIPVEWYEEDKAIRDTSQDKFDEAIRKGILEAQPGDKRYVPAEGITYKTSKSK